MNKIHFFLLSILLILTGCAHGYVITMSNGERIRAASKPRFDKGFYYFKDSSGHVADPVFAGRVREIAPASQAGGDPNAEFKVTPSK